MAPEPAREVDPGPSRPFLVGTAISLYQNSGDPDRTSNWGNFKKHQDICGLSCNFWNNFEEDLELAARLGSNTFRLSIEWHRIVPRKGWVSDTAIQRYHRIFDVIERHGMEAQVTLHHFVHPQWFEEEGGFQTEESIQSFTDWSLLAFKHFGKRAKIWATFNEPGVAAICGFVVGQFPPGKMANFRAAGTNMRNMLRAHCSSYHALKQASEEAGLQLEVGIVHNVFFSLPQDELYAPLPREQRRWWSAPFWYGRLRCAAKVANSAWNDEAVMEYLVSGTFRYWGPFGHTWLGRMFPSWGSVTYEDRDPATGAIIKPPMDFMGLNQYSRAVLSFWGLPTYGPRDYPKLADMAYPVAPDSLYTAIVYCSKLGCPIYITENGCPDGLDCGLRAAWIRGYLPQVMQAVRDGYDVRGFAYWSLMDNYEWQSGFSQKFGLYEFIPGDARRQRVLREGSKGITEVFQTMPRELDTAMKRNHANPKHDPKAQLTPYGPAGLWDLAVTISVAPVCLTAFLLQQCWTAVAG